MVSIGDIQRSISDDKAISLLKIIAAQPCRADIILLKTRLTRKQYYSRMSGMIKVGLVKRRNGKYSLTSFGKLVYDSQIRIENAIENYWKLKAVDSFEISDNLSKGERKKLIDDLIDSPEIKDILFSNNNHSYSVMTNMTDKSTLDIQEQQQQQKKYSPKIMLVDDDLDIILTYKAFLTSEEYSVDTFTDSIEALTHFIKMKRSYYDLVITDVRMPGINGLQLYQKLKAIDDSVKVIFVSALNGTKELVSLLNDVYPDNNISIIRKPIGKKDFLNMVKKAFTKS
jgi:CheY-like chemotaxis protein